MKECVCPSCSANLSIHDTNRDFAFCEFCGAKVMLDDYRITPRFIDEAELKRVEIEQENMKLKAMQAHRREILAQWDAEQFQEEAAVAKAKKNLITCAWLCLLVYPITCAWFCLLVYPIFVLPFFRNKYNNLKNNYESKKKYKDYMRTLPLDKFFQQMEEEWEKQRENQKKEEEKAKSFKLW
ncbi:MAG: hypothetical protein K2O42_07455 [Oscillospiraceae bacterium]|nr:hypothetical protein [Oscillospiraceae bacterium]